MRTLSAASVAGAGLLGAILGLLAVLGLAGAAGSAACGPRGGPAELREPPQPPGVTCEQLPRFLADNTPEDDAKAPGRVARRMCRKHQQDLCAMPKAHVMRLCPVGGGPADILEFPHMALLGYGDRDEIEYSCGGALVSADFILTAAHCAEVDGRPVRWALLGATNRTSEIPKASDTHQLLEVAEVVVHPEYAPPAKYHDVALLRLARAARLSMYDVRPACLDTDVDTDPVGQEAVATGWGATFFGDEGSERLIKVNLTVRALQFCRERIELNERHLPRGLADGQLCAGGHDDGRDTCQGDSGGPLQLRADPGSPTCIYRLVGVVSFGPPCGLGQPAVYTRVAAYAAWIESVVWPARPDGDQPGRCARVVAQDGTEVRVPLAGPGSVARGMCRVYHVDFCPEYSAYLTFVKPDLSLDSKCHHFKPKYNWKDEQNPNTVTLRYGSSMYNIQHGCAGALISPRAVLTAARCRSLGCLPLSDVVFDLPSACFRDTVFAVARVAVHPDYRAGRARADLAVALLEQSVDIRLHLPLCLHTPADPPARPGLRAKTLGWNIDGSWERVDYNLANTTLTVRSAEECGASLLGPAGAGALREALPIGWPTAPAPAPLLCAGGLCDGEAYAGDAGVPLTNRTHFLLTHHGLRLVDRVLGVASSLTYCSARAPGGGLLPDLFTSAAAHVAWIEGVAWPGEGGRRC